MTSTKNPFDIVAQYLSTNIFKKVTTIPKEIKQTVQEIRLRVNRPVSLYCHNNVYYLTENGCITNSVLNQPMLVSAVRDISDTFNNICNYSVYSRQNEIKNGFITLKGGHRAGICGTAVIDNNSIINIRDISSINIRISSEHKGCSEKIINNSKIDDGILICGAPCSGKTTVLRDMARWLSTSYNYKVSLIDQRSEIAGTYCGVYQNDIGMCDVLDGYSKADGFSHAIRCLAPEIIICDEIGSMDDVSSVENAVNSGVSVIASLHCSNKNELLKKPFFNRLLEINAFGSVVFLKGRESAGQVSEMVCCNELIA